MNESCLSYLFYVMRCASTGTINKGIAAAPKPQSNCIDRMKNGFMPWSAKTYKKCIALQTKLQELVKVLDGQIKLIVEKDVNRWRY